MSSDTCLTTVIHDDRVALALTHMPDESILADASEIFGLLSDPSRLRILQALSVAELCVCDLAAILTTSSSAVSHQLRLLRGKRIVRFRKEGKIAYYSLADAHVLRLMGDMLNHLQPETREK